MKKCKKFASVATTILFTLFCYNSFAWADPCIVSDNGSGTIDLPANCEYTSAPDDPMMIIAGLPPGTTIEMAPVFDTFYCNSGTGPSCSLPPTSYPNLDLTGTGGLAGYTRSLTVPMHAEVHTGPRNPGDPVQMFPADMYRLQGQIVGDPDFNLLGVTGGTNFGLPSPGQTTLTELPSGDFNVDSFFDITYQIQFVGAPGSVLEGMSGTTTATVRWQQGITVSQIPTLSECGIIIFMTLMMGIGVVILRKRRMA
jgi:hypothetical protein